MGRDPLALARAESSAGALPWVAVDRVSEYPLPEARATWPAVQGPAPEAQSSSPVVLSSSPVVLSSSPVVLALAGVAGPYRLSAAAWRGASPLRACRALAGAAAACAQSRRRPCLRPSLLNRPDRRPRAASASRRASCCPRPTCRSHP